MDSGIKGQIQFYIIVFACAFIVAVYTCKPLEIPEFTTNESGELVCSVCEKNKTQKSEAIADDIQPVSTESNTHAAMSAKSPVAMNIPGRTITIDKDHIKSAVVEHVELYPKEHAQSDQTIT